MASWEDRLASWTGPASDTEDDKRDRTEREIKKALAAHPGLSRQTVKVYAKGSYANNTNVRLDSDVDIAVENTSIFHPDGLDEGDVTREEIGFTPYDGPYPTFESFKQAVHEALVDAFGTRAVRRENKCITVRERSTTLPADVVPCWTYHDYYRSPSGRATYQQGTVLWADRNKARVENYPQQHYDNGVSKNQRTRRRYKETVRVVKRLENEMVDARVIEPVPSYLIECLVYACPDHVFSRMSWVEIVRGVLGTVYDHTRTREPDGDRWLEVNDIKYLFHPAQKWTQQQAHRFSDAAWDYLELG